MPAAKTDEMTQAVGVDESGGLWALPGGGASGGGLGEYAGDMLASGTFDLSAYTAKTRIESGISLAKLKEYKKVRIYVKAAEVVSGFNVVVDSLTTQWPASLWGGSVATLSIELSWVDDSHTYVDARQLQGTKAQMWQSNWQTGVGIVDWTMNWGEIGCYQKWEGEKYLYFYFSSDKAETTDIKWYVCGVFK